MGRKKRKQNPLKSKLPLIVLGGAAAGGVYLWRKNRLEHEGELQPDGSIYQDPAQWEPVPLPAAAVPGVQSLLPAYEPSPDPARGFSVRWGNGATMRSYAFGQSAGDPVALDRVIAPNPIQVSCQWNEVLIEPRWYAKPYGAGPDYAQAKHRPPDDGSWYYVGSGGSVVFPSTLGAAEWPYWKEAYVWVALELVQGDVILASGRNGPAFVSGLCGYIRIDRTGGIS